MGGILKLVSIYTLPYKLRFKIARPSPKLGRYLKNYTSILPDEFN